MDLITLVMACSLYQDNSMIGAMIELGSENQPLTVTVEPNGPNAFTKKFKSSAEATRYTQTKIAEGVPVDIGLMQIPSQWLADYKGRVKLDDLFRSCKNVVTATDILNHAFQRCASSDEGRARRMCALSVYKTGDESDGLSYARQVLRYAKHHPLNDPTQVTAANTTPENKIQAAPGLPSELGMISPDGVPVNPVPATLPVQLPEPTFSGD